AQPNRAGPRPPHKLEAFVEEHRASVRIEALAELDELAFVAAEAGTEDDVPAVQSFQRAELLGYDLRPATRQGRDGRAKGQPIRGTRYGREGDPWICRWRPPHEREVVPDEVAVPPPGPCSARCSHGDVRIGPAPEIARADRELQRPVNRGSRFSTNAV